jgi:hypothetical protein
LAIADSSLSATHHLAIPTYSTCSGLPRNGNLPLNSNRDMAFKKRLLSGGLPDFDSKITINYIMQPTSFDGG